MKILQLFSHQGFAKIQYHSKPRCRYLIKNWLSNQTNSFDSINSKDDLKLGKSKMLKVVIRLEKYLHSNYLTTSDEILKEFSSLEKLGVIVPLKYFYKALDMSVFRNDLPRFEVLIHFAKNHLENSCSGSSKSTKCISSDYFKRKLDDPFHKFLRYSMKLLFLHFRKESYKRLYDRLKMLKYFHVDNLPYGTVTYDVARSRGYPSIRLNKYVNRIVKSNLWHQNSEEFSHLVKLFNRYCMTKARRSFRKFLTCWRYAKQYITYADELNSQDIYLFGKKRKSIFMSLHLHANILSLLSTLKFSLDFFPGQFSNSNVVELNDSLLKLISERTNYILNYKDSSIFKNPNINLEKLIVSTISAHNNLLLCDLFDQTVTNEVGDGASGLYSATRNGIRVSMRKILIYFSSNGDVKNTIFYFSKYLDSITKSVDYVTDSNLNERHDVDDEYNQEDIVSFQNVPEKVVRKNSSIMKADDNSYARYVAAEILKYSFSENLFKRERYRKADIMWTENQRNQQRIPLLNDLAVQIISTLQDHNIKVDQYIYSKWIQALVSRRNYDNYQHVDLAFIFDNASKILSSIESSYKYHDEIVFGLLSLLCDHKSPQAVIKAFLVVKEMTKTAPGRMSWKSWQKLIKSCIYYLPESDLLTIVPAVEDCLVASGPSIFNNKHVVREMLYAHSRLKNGFKCLQLLQYLRSRGARMRQSDFLATIRSIYLYTPVDASDWDLVKNPMQVASSLLRDMRRDNIVLNYKLLVNLLRLFTKASRISKAKPDSSLAIIHEAELFVSLCSRGYQGFQPYGINEVVVSELIRACCLGHHPEHALKILEEYPQKYGYRISALSYEPLLKFYISDVSKLYSFIDIVKQKNIHLSKPFVDRICESYMSKGSYIEAVNTIKNIYRDFGLKPSHESIFKLLDFILQKGDVDEARRLVHEIESMFSILQRQLVVVNASNLSKLEEHYLYSIQNSSFINDSQLIANLNSNTKNIIMLDSENDIDTTLVKREKDYLCNATLNPTYVAKSRYGPKIYGAFTRSALKRRFKTFGFDLEPLLTKI